MGFRTAVLAVVAAAALFTIGALWYAGAPDDAAFALELIGLLVLAALLIVLPGMLIGIACFRIVRRFVPRDSGKRAIWTTVSGVVSGALSVAAYSVLLHVVTLPYDSDGVTYILMFWIPLTAPVVAALGVAFGAGWRQWK